MSDKSIILECEVDEKSGTLCVQFPDQIQDQKYTIIDPIVSDDFILRRIDGMPNEINGSLSFNFSEDFILGFKAESFIGFPKLITKNLTIGCRALSFYGLEETVCSGRVKFRIGNLKVFKYFPMIDDMGSFHLIPGSKSPDIILRDIASEYSDDLFKFAETLGMKDVSMGMFEEVLKAGRARNYIPNSHNIKPQEFLENFLNFKFRKKPKLESVLEDL